MTLPQLSTVYCLSQRVSRSRSVSSAHNQTFSDITERKTRDTGGHTRKGRGGGGTEGRTDEMTTAESRSGSRSNAINTNTHATLETDQQTQDSSTTQKISLPEFRPLNFMGGIVTFATTPPFTATTFFPHSSDSLDSCSVTATNSISYLSSPSICSSNSASHSQRLADSSQG